MKEKTIPKKLKGTVLFTVVSVMMVLIVFLVATLALATTASKRAYTNYQQEQTEYTAKAVMEAVTRQIQDDVDGLGIRGDIVNVAVGADESFDVTISDGTSTETHPVVISNTGETRAIYDASSSTWQDLSMFKISVTVGSNTTTAESTYESLIGLDLIYNPGTPPTPVPTGGDGGAFVSLGDTGGNELATKGYTTGGTYLGIDSPNYSFTMSSSGSNVIDAPFYVNGDLNVPSKFFMHFTKPDDFMVVRGDFSAQNNDIQTSFAGYDSTNETYENTPYIYVEGKLSSPGSKFKFGESDHAVNVYCGSLEVGGNGFEMWGDMYLMDEDKESVIKSSGASTRLYRWSGSTFTRTEGYDTQYGNIYSMGSLKVEENNGLIVDGNVQINGDLTVSNLTVSGDVVVNGTLNILNNLACSGNIYAGKIENHGNIHCSGTVNAVEHSGADPVGKTFTDITGLAPTTTTITKNVYYTDVATWINTKFTEGAVGHFADDEYEVQAAYVEHVIENGIEKTNAHGDRNNNNYYYNREKIIEKTVFDPASAPDIHTYLMTNHELYKNLNTATDPSTAITVNETKNSYDLSSVYGRDVYPSDYTRQKLNEVDPTTNKSKIENPQASNYESMYPVSVDGLDPTIYSGGQYQVPVYGNGTKYGSANPTYGVGDLIQVDPVTSGEYYKVTADCVLNGYFNKNVYIDGSVGNLTVVLDRVQFEGNNGASIIVNDANNVTLFIVDYLNLGTGGQGTSIITTDYLDMFKGAGNWNYTDNLKGVMHQLQNDVHIKQVQTIGNPEYPNVTIHSDADTTLNVPENGLVVALIRAPKLVYDGGQATVSSRTVEYELPTGQVVNYGNGYDIPSDGCNAVGLIGQLIAGQIRLSSNGSWGMLYVTDPTSTPYDPNNPPQAPDPGTPATTTSAFTMLYGNMY